MDLHLFDTSNYIYAGARSGTEVVRGVIQSGGPYCSRSAPVGGIMFLLKWMNYFSEQGDSIAMPVFDRTPVIKREMYTKAFGDPYGYKGTRAPKPKGIEPQKEYAEWICRDIGFATQAVDGYESDDVIYSIVYYAKQEYCHVYIHTLDSDLFFLVSDNVTIEPISVGSRINGKHIDMWNYHAMADSKRDTLYNTRLIRKLCEGDSSDNIPGVGWGWGEVLDKLMPNQHEYSKLGDLNLCRKYLREAAAKNPEMAGGHMLIPVFDIISPLLVPAEEIDFYEHQVDRDKLQYYLAGFNQSLDKWDLEDKLSEFIDMFR